MVASPIKTLALGYAAVKSGIEVSMDKQLPNTQHGATAFKLQMGPIAKPVIKITKS
jgi:hypothetical protein